MSCENSCPNRDTWQQWLFSEGNVAVEDDQLIRHLDECAMCRERVTELSAADPFFQQSQVALRSSGLTSHDWRLGEEGCSDSTEQRASPGIVSLVESLLGPSDDERSMGRLGRFEILGVVGSGGMGIVLKARSIDMDRIVAIKIPQPQYWQSPETLMTLEREARSAAAVVHPNVISIYHVDRFRDVPYLVMPYLPGESLEQRIRKAGPMTVEETLRIARQVVSALAAAHACGVVHRDIKPANILLGAGTERVVLSDFGLAKIQTDATCTATGTFAGTPIYLSPEQAQGCGAGPSGDLFSLGSVIWTLLVGHPPMIGMHTHAIVRQVAEGEIPKLTESRADVPMWMNRLVSKLHDPIPARRPTAAQLLRWIESCQQHLMDTRSAKLPTELSEDERFGRRKVRGLVVAVSLCLIGCLVWQTGFGTDPELGVATVDERESPPPSSQSRSKASMSSDSKGNAPVPSPQRKTSQALSVGADQVDTTELSQQIESQPIDPDLDFITDVRELLERVNEHSIPDWEYQTMSIEESESSVDGKD